ncbi:MAG: SDR family oxidoreductase [Acidimicrobiales bacterium]|nr:SDR family oxidoreductase [Acidimicrobiales bacterium]MDG1877020.1 SDR family oxidoreductase [Acidimicrobiales bacterium]
MGICEGRVVIVTGAARGLGRAHALAFAEAGARVVVNDLGVDRDGSGGTSNAAEEVVAEIRTAGGDAIANAADVADWSQAEAMVSQAVDEFGRLDTLVLNAGFLRDRMLAGMSEDEWDSVTRVHLKGHFAPARHAIEHWRERAKSGEDVVARVVNTSSGAGLSGSIGQGNYAAAKAAIAQLTIQQAAEWGRYGVMANAVAPDARTRMTAGIFYDAEAPDGWDPKAPDNVSPLVVWLGSGACDLTGRVFEASGGQLNMCDGWQKGPVESVGERQMSAEEAGDLAHRSIAAGPDPAPVYGAS